MPNIFTAPPGGFPDGAPGNWAVGTVGTQPAFPFQRWQPWMYDGAVYGYREFGALAGSNYGIRGADIAVANPTNDSAADYANELDTLNAGCNFEWSSAGNLITYGNNTSGNDATIQFDLTSTTPEAVVKASMAAFGIVQDVWMLNNPGPDQQMESFAYGVLAAAVVMTVTTLSPAAATSWTSWLGETASIWGLNPT